VGHYAIAPVSFGIGAGLKTVLGSQALAGLTHPDYRPVGQIFETLAKKVTLESLLGMAYA